MASQLRFEGPELEKLLDRVRREVGADAQIVAANRIRKGGLGGFFAREAFEVIVDTSNLAERFESVEEKTNRTRVPRSVLDLAEGVSQDEREQIVDLAYEEAPHEDDDVLSLSTETRDFGAMLARLSRELDREEEEMPLSAQPRTNGHSRTVHIDDDEHDRPVSPRDHYRRVTVESEVTVNTAAAPPPPPAAPVAPPPPVMQPPAAVAPVAPLIPPAPANPMAPADPRLAELGLPGPLVPSMAATSDLRSALIQRLAQLPPPPPVPRSAGVLIAVVGIGTAPISLARRLADELDLDSEHIALASPEPGSELSHPDQADAFRRSCRRREEPTIVACSIGAGRAQLGWAHRVLDGLEPTVTWAVVDASCKPDDVAHRVKLLGGVDVLALTGIAETVSPAAVLTLDVPVGRLGAAPATPAAWADLLMERLER